MEKLEWEGIASYTERLKVPGGWIVMYAKTGHSNSMVFIKDEIHIWSPKHDDDEYDEYDEEPLEESIKEREEE